MLVSLLQVGEIMFFDLKFKRVVHTVYVTGCVDELLLASLPDSTSFLLVYIYTTLVNVSNSRPDSTSCLYWCMYVCHTL